MTAIDFKWPLCSDCFSSGARVKTKINMSDTTTYSCFTLNLQRPLRSYLLLSRGHASLPYGRHTKLQLHINDCKKEIRVCDKCRLKNKSNLWPLGSHFPSSLLVRITFHSDNAEVWKRTNNPQIMSTWAKHTKQLDDQIDLRSYLVSTTESFTDNNDEWTRKIGPKV